MIQLLFTVISAEVVLILTLMFKTPIRKLVIMALDQVKRGSGPLVVKTIAGVVLTVLLVSLNSMREIQSSSIDALNPTDQVLAARYLLEASLMGFLLFLLFMIDKQHHYIRELSLLRKTMEAAKKQNRTPSDGKNGSGEQFKALGEEVSKLRTKVMKLESECEIKGKEVKEAEDSVTTLKSQSEGLLLEYDHLLEENRNLRDQLQSIHQTLSDSDVKNM